MRKLLYFLPVVVITIAAAAMLPHFLTETPAPGQASRRPTKEERVHGAIEFYRTTSMDLDLGDIPEHKLREAIHEARTRLKLRSHDSRGVNDLANARWQHRGPSNIGGRTIAIMIDKRDPTRNRIWAGGVSGGVWLTEDITKSPPEWKKVGNYFPSLAIADIAQDPGDPDIIYVATGDQYGGDVPGAGVFRTSDDGETWTQLPSTTGAGFRVINEIYIHTNGDIYLLTTQGGLLRSTDQGTSWEQVVGQGVPGSGAQSNNFHDFYYSEVGGTFFASNNNSLFRSPSGDRGSWVNIGSPSPGWVPGMNRVEFTVCPSDPDIIYAIGGFGQFSSSVLISTNGGNSWIVRAEPTIWRDYGQAWYDLDIAADPFFCSRVMCGGIDMSVTTTQSLSWNTTAFNMHVDHHAIVFDPEKPGRIFFGNDGGIWMSDNGGQTFVDKSQGYVTTQFYACAIHPDAGSPYILGGTQDNNSLQISQPGLSPARVVLGGDGMFCFIDQNEPQYQMASWQGGNYVLSTDGGISFGNAISVNGDFVNRSGYDSEANILYGNTHEQGADFFRWQITTGQVDFVNIANGNISVTAACLHPTRPNRLYLGGNTGALYRIDNAHTGDIVEGELLTDFPLGAGISSVYIDKLNPDDIIVGLFNYGATLRNVWVSNNGGSAWTSIEGDLPDLPVRWAIFDPTNHDKAMIATDAGIWTTEDINGDQTHWEPVNPDNGMPFVRVDMLVVRDSDKIVLAGTFGRGMMTTNIFSAPAAVIAVQPIAYTGLPVIIDGSVSVNAESYEWDLGDNTASQEEVVTHVYTEPGIYTISLTIQGGLVATRSITVLPWLPAPFTPGEPDYTGDFETRPEHFAAFQHEGTGFSRGKSTQPGKDGTNSGDHAWVLGLNTALYQNNTRSDLYTPMFDLSEDGLYSLSFYSKYAIQNPHDGFQLEYSTDAGATWIQLGSRDDPDWYNYRNTTLSNSPFAQGKSYFTANNLSWKRFELDISFLARQATVAFRYVFRADNEQPAQGLAIDDFQINRYPGELQTTITEFKAAYTNAQEIRVEWTTGIEFYCRRFILEHSFNGFSFEEVAEITATGVVSAFPRSYTRNDQSLRPVTYYRLKVISENTATGYYYEFYTPIISVRRNTDPDEVNVVLPNPFSDRIAVSFSSVVHQPLSARLFDMAGMLIWEETVTPQAHTYEINGLSLPAGVYVLSLRIGDGDLRSYKFFTAGL